MIAFPESKFEQNSNLNRFFQLARKQRSGSNAGPFLSSGVVWLTGRILRAASPRFGALVAEEANRKAYLRHIHSRYEGQGKFI